MRFIGPDMPGVHHTFDMMIFAMVGGMGTVLGPLLGNALLAQVANLPPGDVRLGVNFFACSLLNLLAFTIAFRRLSRSVAASAR